MGFLFVDFKVRDCKADFWDLSSDVGFNFLEQLESEMEKSTCQLIKFNILIHFVVI
jgi:hypothetical protein